MARASRTKADYHFSTSAEADLSLHDVDVSACLAELAEMFRPMLSHSTRFDVRSDVGSIGITCSKETLQNAIMLLLRNAGDALPMGGVIVLSASCRGSANNAHIEISVSDTGIGMPQETLRRAKEPYFTTKSGGLGGFGLPLVEEFARAAGGRVQLESEPNVGTDARIYLPAHARSEQ
ncbi:ATP-binding protein [Ensifer adhaerens]